MMEAIVILFESIDWGPDTINSVLAWVPERYRANVEAVLALMAALSLSLPAIRSFLARFAPRFAGSAPVVLIDRLLNVFAANSKKLEERAPVARRMYGIPRRPTIPPPPREP